MLRRRWRDEQRMVYVCPNAAGLVWPRTLVSVVCCVLFAIVLISVIVGSWNDPCLALSPSLQRRNAYEPDTPSAIAARAYEFFVNLLFFSRFLVILFIKT